MRHLFIISILLFLNSCGEPSKREILEIKNDNLKDQVLETYKEGLQALDEGDVLYASKKFNEVELLFPLSEWASKSSLMSAYAFWSDGYYSNSINELKRFMKLYPNDDNLDYAHYLMAMNYYDSIIDEKKDLKPLIEAKKYFTIITNDFKDTDYALDAKYKLDLIEDLLAAKEMYIARHYIKKKNGYQLLIG